MEASSPVVKSQGTCLPIRTLTQEQEQQLQQEEEESLQTHTSCQTYSK